MTRYYKIIEDGEGPGSFLCPPGHPNLTHKVHEFNTPRSRIAIGIGSLDMVLHPESDAHPTVRAQAQRLVESATLVCSEMWLRMVYGYFRNSYSPDGVTRAVADAVTDTTNTRPIDHHLGVMLVREYFPDHKARPDLVTGPNGYGQRPCRYCGEAVQYEARFDALTISYSRLYAGEGWVRTRLPQCADGGSPDGRHAWQEEA